MNDVVREHRPSTGARGGQRAPFAAAAHDSRGTVSASAAGSASGVRSCPCVHTSLRARPVLTGPALTSNLANFANFGKVRAKFSKFRYDTATFAKSLELVKFCKFDEFREFCEFCSNTANFAENLVRQNPQNFHKHRKFNELCKNRKPARFVVRAGPVRTGRARYESSFVNSVGLHQNPGASSIPRPTA